MLFFLTYPSKKVLDDQQMLALYATSGLPIDKEVMGALLAAQRLHEAGIIRLSADRCLRPLHTDRKEYHPPILGRK
jgi:hypothetical protein